MSTINLLPDDYLKQRVQHRISLVCVVLFVVVVITVLGAYAVTERTRARTLQVRDRVNLEYEEATRMIHEMQTLEAQKHMMMTKARLTASLVERVPRSTVLALITNARPEGTSLTEVDLKTKRLRKRTPAEASGPVGTGSTLTTQPKIELAGQVPIEVNITVKGLAGTDAEVARFIANLARNPLISAVDLSFSKEKVIDEAVVREFQIDLCLRQDVDAIDFVKTVGGTKQAAAPTQTDGGRESRS
jgi:Tfp pilus assembly protein PilN